MDNEIPQEKVKQQYHSEKCPVCNGFGTLKYGTKTCQACTGKGYVLVPNFMMDIQTEGKNHEKSENY